MKWEFFRLMVFNALLLLSFALPTWATTFDINLIFGTGLSEPQKAIFSESETFWESILPGYKPGITIPSLNMTASGSSIDGVGGVLGSAGPTYGIGQGGFVLATAGIMSFDTADLSWMESNGTLLSVIEHEMAHVIGFGTLWSSLKVGLPGYQELYIDGTGQYTGAAALAAYQIEFNQPGATFVPVELDGGTGTANSHWDESNVISSQGIMRNELMTGWLDTPTFVSNTTKMSFMDIGYLVTVPEPGSIVLLVCGLLGLLGAKRRWGRLQE